MYTYGWFMLRFDRKQNSVKQLSFNKKIFLKLAKWRQRDHGGSHTLSGAPSHCPLAGVVLGGTLGVWPRGNWLWEHQLGVSGEATCLGSHGQTSWSRKQLPGPPIAAAQQEGVNHTSFGRGLNISWLNRKYWHPQDTEAPACQRQGHNVRSSVRSAGAFRLVTTQERTQPWGFPAYRWEKLTKFSPGVSAVLTVHMIQSVMTRQGKVLWNSSHRTPLVVQWIRIHLPVQGSGFEPLSGCRACLGATEACGPRLLTQSSRTARALLHNNWSPAVRSHELWLESVPCSSKPGKPEHSTTKNKYANKPPKWPSLFSDQLCQRDEIISLFSPWTMILL